MKIQEAAQKKKTIELELDRIREHIRQIKT